jgi:tetratricopeptide (TPR) repeat protein
LNNVDPHSADTSAKNGTRAVFLSYASEDARAAERICDALRAAGVEVWFDRSELRGGDAWDNAIRRQIKSCALFVPLISINSHARSEGYFRLEWKLAVDRSHLMASDRAFLVPVVIDGTPDSDDRVPDRFREVQWMRLPDGETPPSFVEHILRLLSLPQSVRAELPAAAEVRMSAPAGSGSAASATLTSATSAVAMRSKLPWLVAIIAGVLIVGAAVTWGTVQLRSKGAAIVPYSQEDRRLTFAVLPFQAPANDAHGAQVAAATTDEFTARLEEDSLWLQNTPRRSIEEAVAKYSNARDIAKALDVHFLVRGALSKNSGGYSLAMSLVDGSSERILKSETVKIPGEALAPRWRSDLEYVENDFDYMALQGEAKRIENKPVDGLDVRDLTIRAYVSWAGHHGAEARGAYANASELLKRALSSSPDDREATWVTAEINLCDCVMAWSHDVESQKAIGAAALDKYLSMDPSNLDMIGEKVALYDLRGKHEEALLILESMLQKEPDDPWDLWGKSLELLKLNRAPEALPIVDGLVARLPNQYSALEGLAAAIHYAVGEYAAAAQLARTSAARMREDQLSSPVSGTVRLTLAAAEAQLGHRDRAQVALADFDASVHNVKTIAAIKKWVWPTAALAGYEPLYDGLRKAGVPE